MVEWLEWYVGDFNVSSLGAEDKAHLATLKEDMEIARQILIEAKAEFERACDAVFVFVRSKRESE